MAPNPQSMSFDEWALGVDALCRRHFVCSWDDLSGELEPLRTSYDYGETPRQFIEWLAEKFDLIWADSIPHLDTNRLY
jgi:hypothetical protein